MSYMAAYVPCVPQSFEEAITGPDADNWRKAMKEEIALHSTRGTWRPEKLPKERTAVGCRWTDTIKYGPGGEILRYKARLVAQCFNQIPGLEFDDTFSPTAHLESIKPILHLSATLGWERAQDDVTGAFLYSDLDRIIYMKQPPSFEDGTNRAPLLIRGLYGLKQAACLWYKYMVELLASIRFKQPHTDNAVFYRKSESGTTIIAIHVDNI